MTLLVTLSQKMEKGQEKNSLNEINQFNGILFEIRMDVEITKS